MANGTVAVHGTALALACDRSIPASPPREANGADLYGGGYPSSHALVPSKTSSSTALRARSASASAVAQRTSVMSRLPMEIEQMVTALDQRVTHVHQAEDARIRMLMDHVQRLAEGLQAMRVAREIHDERRLKEIRMIESNALLDLGNARQARVEMEHRAEELGNQRLVEQRDELKRHREQQAASHADYSRELSDEVERITTLLEEQRATRVEYGDRIAQPLEGEFQKVQETIVAEQKLRFEAEGTMLRMVEDVCSRMRGEIQQERVEREAVQGKLLGLLEDTCNRIEASFHFPLPSSGYGVDPGSPGGGRGAGSVEPHAMVS